MWFYSTIALGCISILLSILVCLLLLKERSVVQEPRLVGKWVSDAERTIEMLPASIDQDSEGFQSLRALLGKVTISFAAEEMSVELDGETQNGTYRVLASDDYSCVLEETSKGPAMDQELADVLKASKFTVIHFEDSESYWVHSQFGGFAEYFRRVP